ncbi:DEAD/DEAH box helicase [Streptomyces endophyticus]|uniref:Helicase associated domain protein n=1 Tax=Streptomyces endophyticus TaxID=714166 RepID=A0ABU6FF36_9ACTN|nr:Helicase associated domain protein [Streptomyces endophyticus]MEB8342558.1 Helicase associated domain protein [Streptomyces endophyticus]
MTDHQRLRPHQVEAVDAVVRALGTPADSGWPAGGLRAQVIAATGTGKSLVGVRAAQGLRARRVLVVVPTLDLMGQMLAAWREGGRAGRMFGVCDRREGRSLGMPCSTDAAELAGWVGGAETSTVFATYASVGAGVLERAHEAGLGAWDLMVVDEAHRTAGVWGKPWAAVHDDTQVPALRRLYMTATPRLWEASEKGAAEVASMDDESVFGPVVFRLPMAEAIERGLIARYQVVCVDISDPQVQAAELVGSERLGDVARGKRLAALQTAVLKTSAEHRLRKVLTFHHRTSEAEAFARGVPRVARVLWEADGAAYPQPGLVWAEWLCGEHKVAHRRAVLDVFGGGVVEDAVMERCLLSSARVLGEGVDTAQCDAVVFADVRGSVPDVVQAVGRALRMRPGEGKVASLVVPVFLGAGEEPDDMLASRAYGDLIKVLTALRAHDAEAVEQLAVAQVSGDGAAPGSATGAGKRAGALLSFSQERDPVQLAAFISARVLRPEGDYWRRGLASALAFRADEGHLRVPYGHCAPDGFPLGVWIATQRQEHRQGQMPVERVRALDEVGMVWSRHSLAFDEGLDAAKGWAAEHGHLLAPRDAVWQGFAVGVWLKNQRAAARRGEGSGGLSVERRKELEEIDPAWCPRWPVDWQRCFHLARLHVAGGGSLMAEVGAVVVAGDDLGRWAREQTMRWDGLSVAQQWMLSEVLGLRPSAEPVQRAAAPVQRRSRAQKWAANLEAARQYARREGHLEVPRSHVETVDGAEYALGVFIANCRDRRGKLAPDRVSDLEATGMRWQ